MRKGSIVDDLDEKDVKKGHGGYPILFANPEIRRMLRLVEAGKDDIFCDLGCGLAQNLIIAASEFNVRKAIGFERNEKRFEKARDRIKLKGLSNNCKVFHESFEKLLDAKFEEFRLEDATIVFYGLSTDTELLQKLQQRLQKGCRLVYYNLCLFPEIMPDKSDFPFYVSKFPFRKTTSELKWLRIIVSKEKSVISKRNKPGVSELWDELSHDYRHFGSLDDIKEYKKRFC